MKQTFWTIAILVTLTFSTRAQDKIEWDAKRRLTVNDFKKSPPDPSTKQSLIARSGVEVNLNREEIKKLKTFNNQIGNYFYPNDSWILLTDPSMLRYIQTCFDIDEWKARTLRKRYNENSELILSSDGEKIRKEVEAEFKMIREQYDSQTEYADNALQQLSWEK
jgi:hypothetical protein